MCVCVCVCVRQLKSLLEENNKINEIQQGFRTGRSCLSQLLTHHERIIQSMEHSMSVDIVYLDFTKAFDKVDHCILLHKVRHLLISGNLAVWLHNFLINRTQFVSVNVSVSQNSIVKSGVPQGSVLGPLLFLIHISDINEFIVHSVVSSFADDTPVLMPVNTLDDADLCQSDLSTLYTWSTVNNMVFNEIKFEHMHYTAKPTEVRNSYMAPDGSHI